VAAMSAYSGALWIQATTPWWGFRLRSSDTTFVLSRYMESVFCFRSPATQPASRWEIQLTTSIGAKKQSFQGNFGVSTLCRTAYFNRLEVTETVAPTWSIRQFCKGHPVALDFCHLGRSLPLLDYRSPGSLALRFWEPPGGLADIGLLAA
jgi:hypothetical protein